MAKAGITIQGDRALTRRLRKLVPRVQKKVIRQAMRAGIKIVAAEIKATAPVESGLTKRNVKVRALKSRRRGSIALEARIAGKGTELYKTSKDGKTVFYPAIVEHLRHFMKRAFHSKGEKARETTMDAIRAGILREASTP